MVILVWLSNLLALTVHCVTTGCWLNPEAPRAGLPGWELGWMIAPVCCQSPSAS